MKIVLGLFLVFVFAQNSFALPLIFSVSKEIQTSDSKSVEIALFDSSKYKKIRVGAKVINTGAEDYGTFIIEGIEQTDFILLSSFQIPRNRSHSITLETIPNKIRLSADVSGLYKIYIWGE